MPGTRRGVEGGVRRLYFGNDGAVMTLWIVNSVSKSERESIIAACTGSRFSVAADCRR